MGDFWQPFCAGKNNGGHKARLQKTNIARGKRHFLDSAWPVKVLAADRAVMVRCPRHLREQSPFSKYKKSAKNNWISWHCPLIPQSDVTFFENLEPPRWTPLWIGNKNGVTFHILSRNFKQKMEVLPPRMTKIASREGPCLNHRW